MTPTRKLGCLLLGVTLAAAARLPAAPASEPIALAGEWRFALDRSAQQTRIDAPEPLPAGDGLAEEWLKRDLPDRILLPGILQAQGYGDDIRPDTPWVLTLGAAWWQLQPADLRDRFSQPGHVEVPFLAQPPKHYLGAAWYQREVEIPADWAGRRVALFLERPHWETTVWIDDRPCGSDRSLVAPHVHELGSLAPGKHRLSIRVDNRRLVRNPGNDEHAPDGHSVSDSLGAAWNGIVGRIELRATTPVWIADAQVFPDVSAHSARVRVRIGNATGRSGTGQISAGGRTAAVAWNSDGGQAELDVPLGEQAQPWDEFHPVLQRLAVTLAGEQASDTRALTFGLREVSWQDKELRLNGHAVNLRTTHFGGDFPLTGSPAMDAPAWKKIFQTCRDYGLNGMRFHSWCPPEAAFAAADELGFYLQPEAPLWAPLNPGGVYTRMLEEETARLLAAYGNHPSFLLLSPSNEPGGRYTSVTPRWAAENYARDPRRLYAAGTGWANPAQVSGGAQYATLVRFPGGELRNVTGWFGSDYRAALKDIHLPVFAHEIGQWCAYPNFDVDRKFTGYLRPGNYHVFREIAARNHLSDQNSAFAQASGTFQLACYKEEIEANLRTPGLAGYQLLDLHDYLGQGTALIGVLDAFWESKGYAEARDFRRFNGATVPLARLARRTFTTAETLSAEAEIYHFGDAALTGVTPEWKIVDAGGRTVAGSTWEARAIPLGKNIPLGRVSADLSGLPAPAAYRLVVGLRGTDVENDWNFWLYPAPTSPEAAPPADVLETSRWDEAATRLAAGGKVLFTPDEFAIDQTKCPPMKSVPVFWNIQMTVRPPHNPSPRFDGFLGLLCDAAHPALAGFPTRANCDWQWTPLVDNVRAINLSGLPTDLRPIVACIDDWNRSWRLGVVFECRVGPGRLLVSAIPLTGKAATIGTGPLRRSLLDYMAGEKFAPPVQIAPEDLHRLWRTTPSTPPPPAARTFDPDLNDGTFPTPPAFP